MTDKTARRDNVEYHHGKKAFEANKLVSDNPYDQREDTDNDSRYDRWRLGWIEARDEFLKHRGIEWS